jgi:protein-disulfide isomerase
MNIINEPNAGILTQPVTDDDHFLGLANAPITIVEYGDYECPWCHNAVPILKQVREQLGDRLRFVFRHFPWTSIHPHASAAAEAAEAAGEQGKFWEMHETLFANQEHLAEVDLGHLALKLGLDIYKFELSRPGEKHRRRISADVAGGQSSGVTKTPTFFINGKRYQGPLETAAIIAAAEGKEAI